MGAIRLCRLTAVSADKSANVKRETANGSSISKPLNVSQKSTLCTIDHTLSLKSVTGNL